MAAVRLSRRIEEGTWLMRVTDGDMFVPVTSRQGRAVSEFVGQTSTVIVLGGGFLGHALVKLLNRQYKGIKTISIADSSEELIGSQRDGIPVESLEGVLRGKDSRDLVVFFCSNELRYSFHRECERHDFQLASSAVISLKK